jgi:hypothetical protein
MAILPGGAKRRGGSPPARKNLLLKKPAAGFFMILQRKAMRLEQKSTYIFRKKFYKYCHDLSMEGAYNYCQQYDMN